MRLADLITIVDDDESIREALRRLFRSFGFDVATFSSAEEFLDSGDLQASACLILDLRMPGISGLELQSRLVSDNRQVPIVFLTGHDDEQARAQAFEAGAIDFLSKPFTEESLMQSVRLAVDRHRMEAR